MPKVSKIKLTLETSYGEDYEIWYNAKGVFGFSIKGLPLDFETVTDSKIYGYDTEKSLSMSMYSAVQRYKESKTKSRKVIVYSASATAELTMDKISAGSYSGRLKGISDKLDSFGHGAETASFGLTYAVRMEIDHVNVKKYHDIKPDGNLGFSGGLGHKFQVMEWTLEREQFFENLYESMRAMVLKVSNFIGQDTETAALLIDSKQNLLG